MSERGVVRLVLLLLAVAFAVSLVLGVEGYVR